METNDKEIRQLKNIIKESVKNILSGLKQNKSKSEDFNIEDYSWCTFSGTLVNPEDFANII